VAERAGVEIEIHVSTDAVIIEGDDERLAQVLDNLIQNALSAMPDGGRLAIGCQATASEDGLAMARLTVEDTGRGIPAEDHERIFEPFFTGRETGTGLGLAIARELVEAHGGRISFVNREGRGALFLIELPQRIETREKKESEQRSEIESRDTR
jgi:two-component system sensor histidine kinase HydH